MRWVGLWSSKYYTELREQMEKSLIEAFKPISKLFEDLSDELYVFKDTKDFEKPYHINPKTIYGNRLVNTKGFVRIEKHARSNCK